MRPGTTCGGVCWIVLLLCAAGRAGAQPAPAAGVASASFDGSEVRFQALVSADSWLLTVIGPAGFELQRRGQGEPPPFSLFDRRGQPLADGTYTYELRAERAVATGRPRAGGEDGRIAAGGRTPPSERPALSGTFTIRHGAIVPPRQDEALASTPKLTVPEDLIVQRSACVGLDCVTGESFGFDTIRLKENNLRIKFEDTSAAGFPTTDWQLTANDSAAGGASRFSIDDVDAARTPLTIMAGAPTNSIFVAASGRLGLRTATPLLAVHAAVGDTPGLRLDQDSSGGFSPQVWDVAGNEANFFVRDVTGGGRLPFRIRPGAPTSSLDVAATGNVGIGTDAPTEALHVSRNAAAVKMKVVNTAATPENAWELSAPASPNSLFISSGDPSGPEVEITARQGARRVVLRVDGSIRANNVGVSSSRELKTDVAGVDPEAVLARLAALPMAEWRYQTEDASVRHLGPMAEDFAAAFGLGDDGKTISVVDASGVALVSVQALYRRLREQDAAILSLQRLNAELAARLALLEARAADPSR